MSRSDQYIGLTRRAQEFVKGLEHVGEHCISGAFDNQIGLGAWVSKKPNPNGLYVIYIEVVQKAPWSSGPMYFTRLLADYNNGAEIFFFSWSDEPWTEDWRSNPEYDDELGICYI